MFYFNIDTIDYKLTYEVLLILAIILLVIVYSNIKLKKEINKRKLAEKELSELNNTLENRVEKSTSTLQKQNILLQESVTNFQNILDATMEMIVFYNIDDKNIIEINSSGIKMLGYKNKSEVIGRNIVEFILESELPKVQESIKLEVSQPYELILVRDDGSLLYTINKARSIIKDGKKIRMTTLIDLTQIKLKEKQLQQQSRLAQMGEMISMIAHQWRQPLGAISSSIIGVKTNIASNKYDLNIPQEREIFLDYIDKKHTNINNYVQFLSNTIDDFRNFFKPDKNKELITLTYPINKALDIISGSLKNRNINIKIDLKCDKKFNLYKNELVQVILNILKNSEDNFRKKKIPNPKINIITTKESDCSTISISDNGGGIDKDIIDKIFDPYFSTKDEKNGTGLGLYMSKMIIEDHNNGLLNVRNTEDGVCFKIIF